MKTRFGCYARAIPGKKVALTAGGAVRAEDDRRVRQTPPYRASEIFVPHLGDKSELWWHNDLGGGQKREVPDREWGRNRDRRSPGPRENWRASLILGNRQRWTSRAPTTLAPTAHAAQVRTLDDRVVDRTAKNDPLECFIGDEHSRGPICLRQIAGSGEASLVDLGNPRFAIKSPAHATLTLGERRFLVNAPSVAL